MRRVVGNRVLEITGNEFAQLRSGRQLLVDVGTGDGKHVLHQARARPDWLVVGLDAAPDRMRKASLTASSKPARGGTPNAIYVWAAVERLPAELTDVDEIHVLMPWGSLLRETVGPDGLALGGLRAASRATARMLITLNLHAWRPPVPEVGAMAEPSPEWAMTELAAAYRAAGWSLDRAEYLDGSGIDALATSWARRLQSSRPEFDVLALHASALDAAGDRIPRATWAGPGLA
jgi:16S rRNA (adenine(1408)-N(1))-methyltransferase